MAVVALALFIAFLALVAGVRTWIQLRRTGEAGDRRATARLNPVQRRIDAVATVGALAVGVVSPVAALLGLGLVVDDRALAVGGVILTLLGMAAAFVSQLAMGESWRVGVDPDERTTLVTSGPFRLIRNPILSSVMITCVGLVLVVPTIIGILGLAAVVIAHEMLVRLVEEPYLRRVHGERYVRYANAVGRFVPGIGRLK